MTELTARIPARPETRDMLKALADEGDGERYEDVLQRLLAEHTGDAEST